MSENYDVSVTVFNLSDIVRESGLLGQGVQTELEGARFKPY